MQKSSRDIAVAKSYEDQTSLLSFIGSSLALTSLCRSSCNNVHFFHVSLSCGI